MQSLPQVCQSKGISAARKFNCCVQGLLLIEWEEMGLVGVRFGDNALSAGINRHVVGDERALQERSKRLYPDL